MVKNNEGINEIDMEELNKIINSIIGKAEPKIIEISNIKIIYKRNKN